MVRPSAERSLGDLFAELAQEFGELLRHEVRLARTELTANLQRTGNDAAVLALAAAAIYAGFLVVLAAVVLLLGALGLPLWLAAFLVGGGTAAVGTYFFSQSLDALKRRDLAPRQTLETLREDRDWFREQIS